MSATLIIALCLISSLHPTAAQDGSCNANDPSQKSCHLSNEFKWKWDPTSTSHPCTIHRISQSTLLKSFGHLGLPNLYAYPLVIYPDDFDEQPSRSNRNAAFANSTTLDNLPKQFSSDFTFTLTGSDSLSSHRRSIPLSQYLQETTSPGETLPDQLGNETWYLFGETFTPEWSQFLMNYELPSCHACTELHRHQSLVALSFGVGNIGSGVQWHLHGPGFSETIHGRKHWVLYPPQFRPEYNLDYASRHWMENVYPHLEDWSDDEVETEKAKHKEYLARWKTGTLNRANKADVKDIGPSTKKPWECTIHEGEMIYFPDGWHHATINLEKYTVFVSSFTSEHESIL
ncbi:hypothetical protein ACHAXN_007252 [Cyclotella atomus]